MEDYLFTLRALTCTKTLHEQLDPETYTFLSSELRLLSETASRSVESRAVSRYWREIHGIGWNK